MTILLILFGFVSISLAQDFHDIARERDTYDGKRITVTGTVTRLSKSKSLDMVRFHLKQDKYKITTNYYLSNRKEKWNESFPCQEGDIVTISGPFKASKTSNWLGTIKVKEKHPVECKKEEQTPIAKKASTIKEETDFTERFYKQFQKDVKSATPSVKKNIEAALDDCVGRIPLDKKRTKSMCEKIPKEAEKDCSAICGTRIYKYGYCWNLLRVEAACKKDRTCYKKKSKELNQLFEKVIIKETDRCIDKVKEIGSRK